MYDRDNGSDKVKLRGLIESNYSERRFNDTARNVTINKASTMGRGEVGPFPINSVRLSKVGGGVSGVGILWTLILLIQIVLLVHFV